MPPTPNNQEAPLQLTEEVVPATNTSREPANDANYELDGFSSAELREQLRALEWLTREGNGASLKSLPVFQQKMSLIKSILAQRPE